MVAEHLGAKVELHLALAYLSRILAQPARMVLLFQDGLLRHFSPLLSGRGHYMDVSSAPFVKFNVL